MGLPEGGRGGAENMLWRSHPIPPGTQQVRDIAPNQHAPWGGRSHGPADAPGPSHCSAGDGPGKDTLTDSQEKAGANPSAPGGQAAPDGAVCLSRHRRQEVPLARNVLPDDPSASNVTRHGLSDGPSSLDTGTAVGDVGHGHGARGMRASHGERALDAPGELAGRAQPRWGHPQRANTQPPTASRSRTHGNFGTAAPTRGWGHCATPHRACAVRPVSARLPSADGRGRADVFRVLNTAVSILSTGNPGDRGDKGSAGVGLDGPGGDQGLQGTRPRP